MTLEEIRICKKLANSIDTLIRNYGHNAYEYCKDKLGGTIADLSYENLSTLGKIVNPVHLHVDSEHIWIGLNWIGQWTGKGVDSGIRLPWW